MTNAQSLRQLVVKIIQKRTESAIALNPFLFTKEEGIRESSFLSEKAKKVKSIIEKASFDRDDSETLAKLSSLFLGETIELDKEEENNDDFDPGEELNIPFFVLLVCSHEFEDSNGNVVEPDTMLLKFKTTSGDEFNFASSDQISWESMDNTGNTTNEFEYDGIHQYEMRFATNVEIERFVNSISESAFQFWFGYLDALTEI